MTTVKLLAVVALFVGGTSLAMAQNGPPTGGQPLNAGNPPAAPPAAAGPPGPGVIPHDAPAGNAASVQQSAAPPAAAPPGPGVIPHDAPRSSLQSTSAQTTQTAAPPTGAASGTRIAAQPKQHKKMYMTTKSTKSHKGSKLTPASNANPYMKQ